MEKIINLIFRYVLPMLYSKVIRFDHTMVLASSLISKLLILAVICPVLASHVNAQNIDFKLQDYQLTDVKFQSFNNSFNLNSNGSNDKNLSADTVYSTQNKSDGGLFANMTVYQNTRKFQSTLDVNLSSDGSRSNWFPNVNQSEQSYHWALHASGSYNLRNYVKGLFFIEVEPRIKYSFFQSNLYRRNTVSPEVYRRTENTPTFSGGLPIKVGYGRLERVEDARQALFLVKQLRNSKRLSRNLTKEDMLQLSKYISKLRNRRFFDDRLQRIFQLKMIDSFYQANDFVEKTDATYFTSTMDYWMFGGTPIRNNGSRICAAIYPFRSKQHYSPLETGSISYFRINNTYILNQVFAGIEYVIDKPISESWQSTTNLRVYSGKSTTTNFSKLLFQESKSRTLLPGSQVHLEQTFGFYPTTRTWFTVKQSFSVVDLPKYQIERESSFGQWYLDEQPFSFRTIRYQLNANYNYYISPRFRLNVNLNYEHARVPRSVIITGRGVAPTYIEEVLVPTYYLDVSNTAVANDVNQLFTFNEKNNAFSTNIRITYSLF